VVSVVTLYCQVNPSTPFRNTSYSFQTYQLGIGGPCQHFTPPAGCVSSSPCRAMYSVLSTVVTPCLALLPTTTVCVRYWCGNASSGGGAFTYLIPSGVVIDQSVLPNSPYAQPDGIVIQVTQLRRHPGVPVVPVLCAYCGRVCVTFVFGAVMAPLALVLLDVRVGRGSLRRRHGHLPVHAGGLPRRTGRLHWRGWVQVLCVVLGCPLCDGCPGSVLAWLWRTMCCGNLSLSDFYVENVFEELDAPAEVRCTPMWTCRGPCEPL
jgi:hypothetical protein